MKANTRIRQNQKLYKHGLKKMIRFPEPRKLPERTLGKLLPGIPGVPAILQDGPNALMRARPNKEHR